MCLVIYAWMVDQDYFKELTDQDVRKRLYEDQKDQIEQDMAPFGFISDGLDEDEFVEGGDRWTKANGDEVFSTYGDSSYMLGILLGTTHDFIFTSRFKFFKLCILHICNRICCCINIRTICKRQ